MKYIVSNICSGLFVLWLVMLHLIGTVTVPINHFPAAAGNRTFLVHIQF